jgi:hypothetical protein
VQLSIIIIIIIIIITIIIGLIGPRVGDGTARV